MKVLVPRYKQVIPKRLFKTNVKAGVHSLEMDFGMN